MHSRYGIERSYLRYEMARYHLKAMHNSISVTMARKAVRGEWVGGQGSVGGLPFAYYSPSCRGAQLQQPRLALQWNVPHLPDTRHIQSLCPAKGFPGQGHVSGSETQVSQAGCLLGTVQRGQ